MDYLKPIHTERRECQDCYKCVRNCPVKAVKIENGFASVIPELCIFCGQCVEVCPNGAKKVRDDVAQARRLLTLKPRVLVSLAPSFVTEFPELTPGQIIQALKRLGFHGVSETALGAQQVSARAAAMLRDGSGRVLVSSACPTVVAYLQKHRPAASELLTGLLSPLLTHCKLLRQYAGPEIGVVFIGPCISKKLEAAQFPALLDVALTFEELRRWFDQEKIVPARLAATEEDYFIPERSTEGAWYPVDGGMIAGMKSICAINDASFMAFSGINAIEKAIDGLEEMKPEQNLFLELLACEGGCVNGPRSAWRGGTAVKRSRILQYGRQPEVPLPRPPALDISAAFAVAAPPAVHYPDSQIRETLRQVGKFSADDELNCGGCGYDSCRAFAVALLTQKAERAMCVTYMRKLAHKKANALIQKMPSAVVIVNEAMRIIEHNAAFASRFARSNSGVGERSSMEGVMLSELVPFASLFHSVLKTGEDILDRDLRFQNTILHASIFTIEKHCVVGGIIQDITEPAVRKEQVIRKAREVIQKNLATVQQIAYLLGENASESEITLNSIIESFSPKKIDEPETTMIGESFIDLDYCSKAKHGQVVSGDVFLSRKIKQEGRIISVLSDGLGSGVKASVLANLTGTMALRYTAAFVDVRKSAKTIMDTLPICEVRKISYSTFTIVDLDEDGRTRVIEHGNPPLLLFRGSKASPLERVNIALEGWQDRVISYSEFDVQLGDRIVYFSDGVSQSGLGQKGYPLGWGLGRVEQFLSLQLASEPELSSQSLARRVVNEAFRMDGGSAKDDITCGVVYYRHPRRLLVITGPPFSKERDREVAELVQTFKGRTAICGGTTAGIVSRLLKRPVTMLLDQLDPEVPPASSMAGVDLVTEGTLTLGKVAEMLERGVANENWRLNPALDLVNLMLESDIIHFVIGTRINEAHQDPNVPVELDLRRNIIRRIASLLETRYLKETELEFL